MERSLLLILFLFCAPGDAQSEKCIEEPANITCPAVRIKCPSGSVIYTPQIVASGELCSNTDSSACVLRGLPVDLVVGISECFWHESCDIKFPTNPIFDSTSMCEPKSLRIAGWQCIKKQQGEQDILICDGKNNDIGTGTKEYGVVLSHENIPWNYEFKMMSCYKIIHANSNELILATVDFFDVDNDNDRLMINNQVVDESGFTFKNNAINITFIYTQQKSKGGSGFVICYKKVKRGDQSNASACDVTIEKLNATENVLTTKVNRGDQSNASASDVTVQKLNATEKVLPTSALYATSNATQTCKLKPKEIKKRCKNCSGNVKKCNKKYKERCPDCCGNNILEKCNYVTGNDNRRKGKSSNKGNRKRKTNNKSKGN